MHPIYETTCRGSGIIVMSVIKSGINGARGLEGITNRVLTRLKWETSIIGKRKHKSNRGCWRRKRYAHLGPLRLQNDDRFGA